MCPSTLLCLQTRTPGRPGSTPPPRQPAPGSAAPGPAARARPEARRSCSRQSRPPPPPWPATSAAAQAQCAELINTWWNLLLVARCCSPAETPLLLPGRCTNIATPNAVASQPAFHISYPPGPSAQAGGQGPQARRCAPPAPPAAPARRCACAAGTAVPAWRGEAHAYGPPRLEI